MNAATQNASIQLVTDIVSAYVSNNSVPSSELPALINTIHGTLSGIANGDHLPKPAELPVPAVPINKSVTKDFLICLEDGKKFKSLRRHLNTSYGMTPDQYRAKWNLPSDYPMVAPNYSETRSNLAKSFGLGRPTPSHPAKGRGRKAQATQAAA